MLEDNNMTFDRMKGVNIVISECTALHVASRPSVYVKWHLVAPEDTFASSSVSSISPPLIICPEDPPSGGIAEARRFRLVLSWLVLSWLSRSQTADFHTI